jgi:hypothetical protein
MNKNLYYLLNLTISLILVPTFIFCQNTKVLDSSDQIDNGTLSFDERHAFELIRDSKQQDGILFVENREMEFTNVNNLDIKDVLNIEHLQFEAALNLYGIDSTRDVFNITTSMRKIDAIYKVTEKPAHPISCKKIAIDIETRNTCIREFIDLQFDEIFEDQKEVKLQIYVSWKGSVFGYELFNGEETPELHKKIEELKSKKFQFYPGIMRSRFVNHALNYSK